MATQDLVLVETLCSQYEIEISFFDALEDIGLITIEQKKFIPQDKIADLEKMIRLYRELNINMEGIDVVFNLLQQVEKLQNQLNSVNNRLRLYEND